jgi:hypothetical protein
VTRAPWARAGASAANKGSRLTSPVKYSAGGVRAERASLRVIVTIEWVLRCAGGIARPPRITAIGGITHAMHFSVRGWRNRSRFRRPW